MATVEANLVSTESGLLLAAGGSHFRSLWVRDFCHSVPGLLKAGHSAVVRDQLEVLFKFCGADRVLPRGLDVVDPKLRVLWNLFLPKNPEWMRYEGKKLKPEYLGEHKTPAYDSNLLFILAVEAFEKKLGSNQLSFSKDQLRELLACYRFNADGCLDQPAFSDWQDSAQRKGPVLLTHLLYWKAAVFLGFHKPAYDVQKLIHEKFYDSKAGLFRERPGSDQIALDSHFFMIKHQFLDQDALKALYGNLKRHPLWTLGPVPGVPVFPKHPYGEISWSTRLMGLGRYHDAYIWGWLTAEAYQCAVICGDEFESEWILDCFFYSNKRKKFLAEIYSSAGKTHIVPAKTFAYRSESPFSWTAAKWLEAL